MRLFPAMSAKATQRGTKQLCDVQSCTCREFNFQHSQIFKTDETNEGVECRFAASGSNGGHPRTLCECRLKSAPTVLFSRNICASWPFKALALYALKYIVISSAEKAFSQSIEKNRFRNFMKKIVFGCLWARRNLRSCPVRH